MIRVLLAEDQAMVRGALSALLGLESDLDVVGSAADGEEAWQLVQRLAASGEGPGEQEDLSGRPFVGRSGKLLTSELQKIGIERKDVFITNIVKCRPPGNRVPLADEIEACNDWLMAQIALIEPKFIVPVGGPSLQTLVSKDLKITKSRHQVFRKDGILRRMLSPTDPLPELPR